MPTKRLRSRSLDLLVGSVYTDLNELLLQKTIQLDQGTHFVFPNTVQEVQPCQENELNKSSSTVSSSPSSPTFDEEPEEDPDEKKVLLTSSCSPTLTNFTDTALNSPQSPFAVSPTPSNTQKDLNEEMVSKSDCGSVFYRFLLYIILYLL